MKKLMTLLMGAATLPATAQLQNGGFEQLNVESFPVFWQGTPYLQAFWFDSLGVLHGDSVVFDEWLYVLNTTDPHSGNHAAELRNGYNYTANTPISGDWNASTDTNTYGFPLIFMPTTMRPSVLSFYGKYMPAGADSAYAEVRVYDEGTNEIGAGTLAIGNAVSVYTLFDVPINYLSQDSVAFVSVHFSTASPGSVATLGTRFLIDDVSMSYSATAVADVARIAQNAPYPNPATDRVTLDGVDALYATVRLYDARGSRVPVAASNTSGNMSVDLGTVAPGIYSLQVEAASGTIVHRVVVR